MTIQEIKEKLNSKEYDFLKTSEHLGDNMILLGLSGSHGYGTEIETSDLDIRGCALNTKKEILLSRDFEQVQHLATDTTVYSFNKFISLLTKSNPNVLELLGLKPEHYLYIHPVGQEIIDNSHMFLSQNVIRTFRGFINSQENKLNGTVRKDKALKYMTHIVRLYLMAIDILEDGEVITYREDNRELLMNIRNGNYLGFDGQPTKEFFKLTENLEKLFKHVAKHTLLPGTPDYKAIDDFTMRVNERIVLGEFL